MSDEGDDSSSPTENKPRRAALVFLFITVALGMIVPVAAELPNNLIALANGALVFCLVTAT